MCVSPPLFHDDRAKIFGNRPFRDFVGVLRYTSHLFLPFLGALRHSIHICVLSILEAKKQEMMPKALKKKDGQV